MPKAALRAVKSRLAASFGLRSHTRPPPLRSSGNGTPGFAGRDLAGRAGRAGRRPPDCASWGLSRPARRAWEPREYRRRARRRGLGPGRGGRAWRPSAVADEDLPLGGEVLLVCGAAGVADQAESRRGVTIGHPQMRICRMALSETVAGN